MKTRRAVQGMVGVVGVLAAAPAWAAGGEPVGLWTVLLLGFGALVILLQAVPALLVFGSMLHAVFTRTTDRTQVPAQAEHGQ